MMIRVAGLALGALTLAVPAANAAVMQATFSGTIYSGYDTTGEFGAAGSDLLDQAISLTFTYDTSVGFQSSPGFEQVIGGPGYGGPSPMISSVVTINGQSQSLGSGYYDYASLYDYGVHGYDQFYVQSYENSTDCVGDICTISGDYALVYTFAFFEYLADSLDQPFTADLSVDDTSYGYFQTYTYAYNTVTGEGLGSEYAYGAYTLDSLVVTQVSTVPLPASFPLIIAALGGLAGLRKFGRRNLTAV
jgi:hypothetical protein